MVVLKLGVMTPLGLNNPFTGVTYQLSCISGMYIMIHSSNKITGTK